MKKTESVLLLLPKCFGGDFKVAYNKKPVDLIRILAFSSTAIPGKGKF